MTSERRPYNNPPIVEGLCQFDFSERLAWNVATPGLLYERLKDEYPNEPDLQEVIQANFQPPEVGKGEAQFSMNRGEQRYVYRDETGTRLVVANAATMSANSLKPYEGWPALRERFAHAVADLGAVTPIPGVSRVVLQYINRILPKSGIVNTDDYFTWPVRTAQSGKASYNSFIHRIQSVLTDNKTQATVTFGSVAESDQNGFLLDLVFEQRFPEPLGIEEGLAVADELKILENEEFESSITDATRELFS